MKVYEQKQVISAIIELHNLKAKAAAEKASNELLKDIDQIIERLNRFFEN